MKAGWPTFRLAELSTLADGDWVETKDQATDGVRLIQTGNVGQGEFKDRIEKARYISPETFDRLRCTEVMAGDCLISRLPDPIGRSCLVPETGEPMITAVDCTIARFDLSRVLPNFFVYYSQSSQYLEAVKTHASGATRNRVSRTKLAEISVPVPPIAEQRRIVAILDEAFEGIATAKANAEKNLENARAVFESELESVFSDLWANCPLATLSDLATDITDGDHLPPPKAASGVPFITIGNIVKTTHEIDFSDTFLVPRSYFEALKSGKRPRKGDVLYTVTGSFGIPVIVDGLKEFCFQRHIGLVRPTPETLTKWLYFLLLSPQVQKQADEGATGAAQRTVSLKLLRNFVVPRPSTKRQAEVAAALDQLSRETETLAAIYQRKLAALDELKKSLLHQAFAGQL